MFQTEAVGLKVFYMLCHAKNSCNYETALRKLMNFV